MNISLRADEKLYINGAVLRVDRKVTLELLNDATFLLENHVIQAHEATTPLRQIYFALQVMLMDPASASDALPLARGLMQSAQKTFDSPEILSGIAAVEEMVAKSRILSAMKMIRALFPQERQIMFPESIRSVEKPTTGPML